ncbi:MAG: peptidase C45 [Lewinellaceae bacterium]|nr:hypothetical protein [Saprospiraceae bacterium]MCB9337795.1 peptidase C45 [Lewinellaceae bacterium]
MAKKSTIGQKIWRIIKWTVLSFLLLFAIGAVYLYSVAIMVPPTPASTESLTWERKQIGENAYTLGNNWLRKSNSGLWEMYVEGSPFERGVVYGKLAKELLQKQEDAFVGQISELVPSEFYRHFLKYFIGWFNRHLDENVPEEFKLEILGVSESAPHEYDYISEPYQRILNYHAAHDIGHALQNLALVGCTSFGSWSSRSADSSLIIGRNFDFYVGDEFAEDKIIAFYNPADGHKFMMVTWGGMTGVVSGMNDQGLTVTLNAAKSDMPSGSATPISLVGREILQYAANIEEAAAIAQKRKTFVAESILIGSAHDHKAVVIEKTPTQMDIYDAGQDDIICTNHYQSEALRQQKNNVVQMEESASIYRYQRVRELLDRSGKMDLPKAVTLLRDRKGLNDADIGMGNEKAVNQLIAHHSIVFQPDKLLVTVSTAPWQEGPFVTYDLNKIFSMQGLHVDREIRDTLLDVAPDSFIYSNDFKDFVHFRHLKEQIRKGFHEIDVDDLVKSNPEYYHTYVLAGDYMFKKKEYQRALRLYETALTKEIATYPEKRHIEMQIGQCKKLPANAQ